MLVSDFILHRFQAPYIVIYHNTFICWYFSYKSEVRSYISHVFFFPDGDLWHLLVPSWQHDALAVQAWAASTCCWQRRRGSQVIKSYLRVTSIRLISINSIWSVVWNMVFSFPYIGNNDPNWLYNIVQRGWNHQPVYIYIPYGSKHCLRRYLTP